MQRGPEGGENKNLWGGDKPKKKTRGLKSAEGSKPSELERKANSGDTNRRNKVHLETTQMQRAWGEKQTHLGRKGVRFPNKANREEGPQKKEMSHGWMSVHRRERT